MELVPPEDIDRADHAVLISYEILVSLTDTIQRLSSELNAARLLLNDTREQIDKARYRDITLRNLGVDNEMRKMCILNDHGKELLPLGNPETYVEILFKVLKNTMTNDGWNGVRWKNQDGAWARITMGHLYNKIELVMKVIFLVNDVRRTEESFHVDSISRSLARKMKDLNPPKITTCDALKKFVDKYLEACEGRYVPVVKAKLSFKRRYDIDIPEADFCTLLCHMGFTITEEKSIGGWRLKR